jgi:acyl carrier protein
MDAVASIIAKVLGVPPGRITDQTSMQTCAAWDSLRHFAVILAIEEGCGIRFPSAAIADLTSVAAIRSELARLRCQE